MTNIFLRYSQSLFEIALTIALALIVAGKIGDPAGALVGFVVPAYTMLYMLVFLVALHVLRMKTVEPISYNAIVQRNIDREKTHGRTGPFMTWVCFFDTIALSIAIWAAGAHTLAWALLLCHLVIKNASASLTSDTAKAMDEESSRQARAQFVADAERGVW